MKDLDSITELLYGEGISMLGHNVSDEEAIALAQRRFGHASYCLVRHWIWIDLVMPPSLLEALERDARLPVMIYAHEVVMDSQGRLKPGDWVRTTPMVSFSDGFCFQTRNTAYFLLGPGTRKSAELATVVKVF